MSGRLSSAGGKCLVAGVLLVVANPVIADEAAQRQAQLRQAEAWVQALNGSATRAAPKPASKPAAQRAQLKVVAHQFYDTYKNKYLPIAQIRIYPKDTGKEVVVWNPGNSSVVTGVCPGKVGAWFSVTVYWVGGGMHRWDYQIESGSGTQIDVWKPL